MNPASEEAIRRRRTIAWAALALGVAWAIGQALLPSLMFLDLLLAFTNGLVVTLYTAPLYAVRADKRSTMMAIFVGGVGITHILWVLLLYFLISEPVLKVFGLDQSVRWQNATMFIATGLVFAAALAIASRSWWMVLWMLIATALSSLVLVGWPAHYAPMGIRFHELGLAAAPLHLGIVIPLACQTLRGLRIEERQRDGECSACGYALAGLNKPVCPECGQLPGGTLQNQT